MMSEKDEKALVQNLRKMLDETEAETDPRIKMRLRAARLRALDALKPGSVVWVSRWAAAELATALALV
jgi:hypothetical protein